MNMIGISILAPVVGGAFQMRSNEGFFVFIGNCILAGRDQTVNV